MNHASKFVSVAVLFLIALMVIPAVAQQEVTVRDIQFVHPDSLAKPGDRDNSPLLGQTVTITCVVLTNPRSLWTGARWSFIVADTSYGEWNFLQVVQADTLSAGALATNISALQVGDVVRISGLVNEFPANTSHSQTQIEPLTNPPVPVEFLGVFNFNLPQPLTIKGSDLATADLAEKFECAYVTIENATMLNNNSGNGNGQALMSDAAGQILIDDWFNPVHSLIDQGAGGSTANISKVYPANGARFNVTGWLRDLSGPQQMALGVESKDGFELLSNPAAITNVSRTVAVPTSSQAVAVRARIADNNGTVSSAKVYYSSDNGTTWQTVDMAADTGNFYQAAIPAQANGTFVRYYIWSQDNDGDTSTQPGDLRTSNFFYTVRDNGPTIYDVQYTPFANGSSGYANLSVTVSGVVTADSADFANEYFIQDGNAPWSGLWVRDSINKPKRGDNITITGPVEEYFNQTRINAPTAFTLNSSNNSLPAPAVVKVSDIRTGSPTAESYEDMLVQVRNAAVANPFADGASNFGEFTISDGTGEVRVDDRSNTYFGNLDSTYAQGDSIRAITGVLDYTFSNFKINPRTPSDVVRITTAVQDQPTTPFVYRLEQNYPNPFWSAATSPARSGGNPETSIRYQLAKSGPVTLVIYNMLGQKVRTLIDGSQAIGHHALVWDGRNDRGRVVPTGIYFYRLQSGEFTQVKKMLVVR